MTSSAAGIYGNHGQANYSAGAHPITLSYVFMPIAGCFFVYISILLIHFAAWHACCR